SPRGDRRSGTELPADACLRLPARHQRRGERGLRSSRASHWHALKPTKLVRHRPVPRFGIAGLFFRSADRVACLPAFLPFRIKGLLAWPILPAKPASHGTETALRRRTLRSRGIPLWPPPP